MPALAGVAGEEATEEAREDFFCNRRGPLAPPSLTPILAGEGRTFEDGEGAAREAGDTMACLEVLGPEPFGVAVVGYAALAEEVEASDWKMSSNGLLRLPSSALSWEEPSGGGDSTAMRRFVEGRVSCNDRPGTSAAAVAVAGAEGDGGDESKERGDVGIPRPSSSVLRSYMELPSSSALPPCVSPSSSCGGKRGGEGGGGCCDDCFDAAPPSLDGPSMPRLSRKEPRERSLLRCCNEAAASLFASLAMPAPEPAARDVGATRLGLAGFSLYKAGEATPGSEGALAVGTDVRVPGVSVSRVRRRTTSSSSAESPASLSLSSRDGGALRRPLTASAVCAAAGGGAGFIDARPLLGDTAAELKPCLAAWEKVVRVLPGGEDGGVGWNTALLRCAGEGGGPDGGFGVGFFGDNSSIIMSGAASLSSWMRAPAPAGDDGGDGFALGEAADTWVVSSLLCSSDLGIG